MWTCVLRSSRWSLVDVSIQPTKHVVHTYTCMLCNTGYLVHKHTRICSFPSSIPMNNTGYLVSKAIVLCACSFVDHLELFTNFKHLIHSLLLNNFCFVVLRYLHLFYWKWSLNGSISSAHSRAFTFKDFYFPVGCFYLGCVVLSILFQYQGTNITIVVPGRRLEYTPFPRFHQ